MTTHPPTRISTVDAREAFAEILNRVAFGGETIILTRHGKELVAMVPVGSRIPKPEVGRLIEDRPLPEEGMTLLDSPIEAEELPAIRIPVKKNLPEFD